MPIDLTGHLDRLVRGVEDQDYPRAAEAMADELRDTARRALGGDLTLSGGAGTVVIDSEARRGRLVVLTGGAYRLVDQGRRTVRAATAATGSALRTPWGPRAAARGSTSPGKKITDRGARDAFRAGAKAVVDETGWGR